MSTVCLDCPKIIPKGPRCPVHTAERAERQGYTHQSSWQLKRRQVLELWGFGCASCRRPLTLATMQCDHIIPVADGGSAELGNLQALCRECHNGKTTEQRRTG